jgi:hypothetical protein
MGLLPHFLDKYVSEMAFADGQADPRTDLLISLPYLCQDYSLLLLLSLRTQHSIEDQNLQRPLQHYSVPSGIHQ